MAYFTVCCAGFDMLLYSIDAARRETSESRKRAPTTLGILHLVLTDFELNEGISCSND